VVNFVVASATFFGLWGVVSPVLLTAWGGAMLFSLLARAVLGLAFHRSTDPSRRIWGTGFAVGSGLTGAIWGLAGVLLLPPESLEYQLFILFVLMGLGAGAITTLTAYMPAFHAFLPVSLLPIGVTMIFGGDRIHIALGIMTITYVAGLTFFARILNRTFVESLSLRFENVDLVQALSVQRDEAERANVAKSKFLAAASHDLRQPLQSLTLFASALGERAENPEVRRIAGNINASVRALDNLFNALLDISRLDAGVLQPAIRHFRLQSLCHRLHNEYTPRAEEKGLALICRPCDLVVRSDPVLLERILRNFVSNAIRYTGEGRVEMICSRLEATVRITVSDTGIGIPEAQQREIFKEFHQLSNPERDRTKGLGLGLAIVDRAAKLLGHPVRVESTPGRGSRFSVDVPLGDPHQIVSDETPVTDPALHDLAGMRVTIVDDEISIREGMRVLLQQWGCVVTLAGSEEEAIAAVRESDASPEAVIADYRLRENCTGIQVIERLRQEFGSEIPALIISGDAAIEQLRKVNTGGYQMVHKPVPPAMLRAFLRNARARRRGP
jgi:signal transduction histidine kinase/CheY-like chemotaxis protein